MSDPVTNIEIEDVLSSIRRLVSDEARASERHENEPSFSSDVPPQPVELEVENPSWDEPVAAKSPAPALMLTPALRIVPEEEENSENASSDPSEEHGNEVAEDAALILTQDDFSEEAVQDSEDSSFSGDHPDEDDVSVVAEMHDTTPDDDAHAVTNDDVDLHEPHIEEELVTEAPTPVVENHAEERAAVDTDEPVTIEDKIAALEALISRSDGEFEPDGAEVGGNAGRAGHSLPWEDSAALRASVQSGDFLEPETASHSAAFSDSVAAFERAHSEAVETAQSELAATASDTLLEGDELSSALDEDALRDMVAEIVRQELQGPLGERITRNVRKLVRREIYRALAANELD